MVGVPKTSVFIISKSGSLSGVQHEILGRLEKRHVLHEVNSEDACDVIIAFVPVVSRAGTDIEAALKNIPKSRPVVLVVLHHTFDENYVAPQSKWAVNSESVFAADFLCHEDVGLLKCLANDEALKSITDYLISMAPNTLLIPINPPSRQRRRICVAVFILFVLLFVIGLIVYGVLYKSQGQDDNLTTVIPNITKSTSRG